MFDFTDRKELGSALFKKIRMFEPDEGMAIMLTDWVVDMEDDAITAIFGNDDALEAQVQRLNIWFRKGWTSLDDADEESDSDYEWIRTPSISKASWQIPAAESTDEGDAMSTEPEMQGELTWTINPPPPPSLASLETPHWLADTNPTPSHPVPEAEEIVEATRDPAELDTMKEVCEVSPAPPRAQEGASTETAQDHGTRNPLAPTSTTSYVLGATRNPASPAAAAAAATPAPKKKAVRGTRGGPRAPEGDSAADSGPVHIEMDPYSSSPLMSTARVPGSARRAERRARRAARSLDDFFQGAMCGFSLACTVCATLCCVLNFGR